MACIKVWQQEGEPMTDIERNVIKNQMIKYGFTAPDMTVTEFVEDCLSPAQPEIVRCDQCRYAEVADKEDGQDENCQELAERALSHLPSAESVKAYTKTDYIMALHKEYGCTLTMAEEAHNKALEYLRSKARMKG